jgi:hypothetical protein
MTTNETALAPDGTKVELSGVGTAVVADFPAVRIWDVDLAPGQLHPWHLHHNPYVVLSIIGSTGRMEWLDGSTPRDITEYTGGAVFRPVSPVHRLTNTGDHRYRNHLIELKHLGELRGPAGPLDVGPGARSIQGEQPDGATPTGDARAVVLATDYVRIWTVRLQGRQQTELLLDDSEHLVVEMAPDRSSVELAEVIAMQRGGSRVLVNPGDDARSWFVLSLDYLDDGEIGGMSE